MRDQTGRRLIVSVFILVAVLVAGVFAPLAAEAGRVSGGVYWPLSGDPEHGYITYIRPMGGPAGGIEVLLTGAGISYGLSDTGSIRLAIWTLKGYYQAGGSSSDFPYNSTYVQSIANEIKLHCLYSWASNANPVNIEKADHPGYQISWTQVLIDWKNGIF